MKAESTWSDCFSYGLIPSAVRSGHQFLAHDLGDTHTISSVVCPQKGMLLLMMRSYALTMRRMSLRV